jgi:hypothetical protein
MYISRSRGILNTYFAVFGPQPSCTEVDVENLVQGRRQSASNPSSQKKRGLSDRDATNPSVASVPQRKSSLTGVQAKHQSPSRDLELEVTQNAPLTPSSTLLYCTESPSEICEQMRVSEGDAVWRDFRICTERGWERRQFPSHNSPIQDSDLAESQTAPLSPSSKLLYCTESPSEVFEMTKGSKGAVSWPQVRVCTEVGWEPCPAPYKDSVLPPHQHITAGQRYAFHAGVGRGRKQEKRKKEAGRSRRRRQRQHTTPRIPVVAVVERGRSGMQGGGAGRRQG